MDASPGSIGWEQSPEFPQLCRFLAERSPQPMLAVEGPTHIVRYVNPAFRKLLGAGHPPLIGRPFGEAVPEGRGFVPLLDRVFTTGSSEAVAEQEHRTHPAQDGTGLPAAYWSYWAWPIVGLDAAVDKPVGVMIQVTDATEVAVYRMQAAAMNEALLLSGIRHQELTDKAEAAVKDKEYFIAVLSHELRTPLSPLLIAASMLQEDPRLDPDTQEMMRMFHRNVTQEARLIDDLLDMTRMERGKLKLDRSPVDLRGVLEGAIEACRADIEAGGLALGVDIEVGPQMVEADSGRLQQVFSNLLRNAVKFTPVGGRVGIRSRCAGGFCTVELNDNGAGIDPEFLPRAFSAFEQGDKTITRKPGLGLGLAISKTIVDLHGGAITAQSDGPGLGATFVVRLPALVGTVSELVARGPATPDASRSRKPLRILLVEDHEDTARVMRRLLTLDGHAVDWADCVAEGVQLAGSHEFDLLLSDVGLPDGTGLDLMRQLRQQGSKLPGIIISGYGQDQDVERSREAGFASHLVKPLNQEMLRDAILTLVA